MIDSRAKPRNRHVVCPNNREMRAVFSRDRTAGIMSEVRFGETEALASHSAVCLTDLISSFTNEQITRAGDSDGT
jgi:hypothetical protein